MFSAGVQFYHDAVSDCVLMRNTCGVFSFVILRNKPLLARFDVLPVGLEVNIEDGVATEHQLCRCGARSGVDSAAYGLADGTENSLPLEVRIEVCFAFDSGCANHVVNHLMDSFHD